VLAESVYLSVAQRVDVIIDFSDYKVGESVTLINRLEQTNGRGPTGRLLDPGDGILRFDVIPSTGPDPSQVPTVSPTCLRSGATFSASTSCIATTSCTRTTRSMIRWDIVEPGHGFLGPRQAEDVPPPSLLERPPGAAISGGSDEGGGL
jgi:hypothetical protein